jgi:hypothetical protein
MTIALIVPLDGSNLGGFGARPDNALPGGGAYPGHGLPSGGYPSHGLPGSPGHPDNALPPLPPEIGNQLPAPVFPHVPIYPLPPSVTLPPGTIYPPLPPSVPGKALVLCWVVGVGHRWVVVAAGHPSAPIAPGAAPKAG